MISRIVSPLHYRSPRFVKCFSTNENEHNNYRVLKSRLKNSTAGYGALVSTGYLLAHGGEEGMSVALGAVTSYAYISFLSYRVDRMEKAIVPIEFFAPFALVAFETTWNSSTNVFQFDYGATLIGFLSYKLALSTVIYEIVREMLVGDSATSYETKKYKEDRDVEVH